MDPRHMFSALLNFAARIGVDMCLAFGLPFPPDVVTHEFAPDSDDHEAIRA